MWHHSNGAEQFLYLLRSKPLSKVPKIGDKRKLVNIDLIFVQGRLRDFRLMGSEIVFDPILDGKIYQNVCTQLENLSSY